MYSEPTYREMSATAGVLLITIGMALWATNFVMSVFANWTWAMMVGGIWVALGSLLLYPDVRLYQGEESTTEQYLSAE